MADRLSTNDTQATATYLGVLAFKNDGSYPVTSINFLEFNSVGTQADQRDFFRFEPHKLYDFRVGASISNEPAMGLSVVVVTAMSGTKSDGDSFLFMETGRDGTREERDLLDAMIELQRDAFGDRIVIDGVRDGSSFNKPFFEVFEPSATDDEIVLQVNAFKQDFRNPTDVGDISYSLSITPKSGPGDGPSDPKDPSEPKVVTGTGGKDKRTGTAGDDIMRLKGGNDVGKGGKGHDTIDGGGGKDKLYGQAGNDILIGGKGNDRLDGGGGKDVLRGGPGKDTLKGGGGADRFEFRSIKETKLKQPDVILDFKRKQGDKVDLAKIDADTGSSGNQPFDFIGKAGFSGASGELRYQTKKGTTYIYGDVNGDAKADFAIRIDGRIDLKQDDFML